MTKTGGFAQLLFIRESVLQNFFTVLHHSEQIPHQLPLIVPLKGISTPSRTTPLPSSAAATGFLYLDVPRIQCLKADNYVLLLLRAWGTETFSNPVDSNCGLLAEVTLKVKILATVELGSPSLSLDIANASVSGVLFKIFEGGSQEVHEIVYQPSFGEHVTESIKFILPFLKLPPFGLAFFSSLGTLAATDVTAATVGVFDQMICIGMDVSLQDAGTGDRFSTSGDMSAVTIPPQRRDMYLCLGESLFSWKLSTMKDQINTSLTSSSAQLTELNIAFQSGAIVISLTLNTPIGTVSITFDIYPGLLDYEAVEVSGFNYDDPDSYLDDKHPKHYANVWHPTLKFCMSNPTVNLQLADWFTALEIIAGVLTAGISQVVADSVLSAIRGQIASVVSKTAAGQLGSDSSIDRESKFTLAQTSEPIITSRIQECSIDADGIMLGISLDLPFFAGGVFGDNIVPIEKLKSGLCFSLRFPYGVPQKDPLEDPQLRIRWELRRADLNQILAQSDATDTTFAPVLFLDQLKNCPNEFALTCRLYRVLGSDIEECFYDTETIYIRDRLDRSKPFVRWQHVVPVPNVRVEPDGSHTVLGVRNVFRYSDIHRTDFPGRCLMADKYSESIATKRPRSDSGTSIEYLDSLPFPLSELDAHRQEVCDYCFYGGPTKKDPLL